MRIRDNFVIILCLAVFCALLYGFNMGGVGLSDPDETFYAETAKEMLNKKSFITPLIFNKPQFEKPPMFYWLIILVSLFWGMGEFAVRFVPALFGIIGAISIFFLGNFMFNRKTGIYASIILATNFLYLGLSRCALTDIVFTVFVLLSFLFFFLGYQKSQGREFNLCFFFFFSALAVLTKGPLGILIPIFAIVPFLIFAKDLKFLKQIPWFWGILIFVLVSFPWYLVMSLKHKEFIKNFFFHENIERFFVAEHRSSNRWYFYPAILLGPTLPWNIWLPLIFSVKKPSFKKERIFLNCWFWAPLIFFTAAQSKLASYILPIFPALALILANSINQLDESELITTRLKIGKIISTIFTLIILSGFVVSVFWVRQNFPQLFKPDLLMCITMVLGLLCSLILLWKNKYLLALILNVTTVLIFVIILMSNILVAEGAFSDRDLRGLIKKNSANLKQDIVCSKLYVRGVFFYTGRNVVVINEQKKAFFRPHPIEVISSADEIGKFFKTDENILCVVTQDYFELLNSLPLNRKNEVLVKTFDRYVVLSKPASK